MINSINSNPGNRQSFGMALHVKKSAIDTIAKQGLKDEFKSLYPEIKEIAKTCDVTIAGIECFNTMTTVTPLNRFGFNNVFSRLFYKLTNSSEVFYTAPMMFKSTYIPDLKYIPSIIKHKEKLDEKLSPKFRKEKKIAGKAAKTARKAAKTAKEVAKKEEGVRIKADRRTIKNILAGKE